MSTTIKPLSPQRNEKRSELGGPLGDRPGQRSRLQTRPRVDVLGGPDRGARLDVMGRPDRHHGVDVLGGPDRGPQLDVTGKSDRVTVGR